MFGLALTVVLFGSTFAATTVEMLAADSRFDTLVNFVTQAGLVDTLNAGTFTIFAPTNAAFAKLPAATVQALTADPALLTDVLTYHVTSGSVMSAAAKDEMLVTMVNGGQARFNIYSHNNVVTIQGSTITAFDKVASNGVIHVIDTVMTQPKQSIVDIVAGNSDFSTLLRLVKAANLTNALLADGLTVFAPNNAAFARIPAAELTNLENDAAMLASVLTYHVVGSTEFSTGLYKQELLTTLNGDTVRVHFTHHGADVKINNGLVLSADIQATNGVVHVIDHVLLPGGVVVGRR